MQKRIKTAKAELNALKEMADNIKMNASKYSEPDWSLTAPGKFTTANAYYRNTAAPLIEKYRNEITKLIFQNLEKDKLIHKLSRPNSLNTKITRALNTENENLKKEAYKFRVLVKLKLIKCSPKYQMLISYLIPIGSLIPKNDK